jgi:pimeloyl-ACP methyl ester carboxylesterase
MHLALAGIMAFTFAVTATAQQHVSFPTQDGGVVFADVYGNGSRGVVLAHGGQFNKESWAKQAHILADAGFLVVAIDFRGYGQSHGPGQSDIYTAPLYLDVLAAIHYLEGSRARTVSLIGASMGGWAIGRAVLAARPIRIDRLVFLASSPDIPPEKLSGRKLFIVARDDSSGAGPRLPGIRAYYEKTPEPKQLIVLDGSAHAQFLFQTNQGDRLTQEILRFLTKP